MFYDDRNTGHRPIHPAQSPQYETSADVRAKTSPRSRGIQANEYGKTVTEIPCNFCQGKGFKLKEGARKFCTACDGTGYLGGEGEFRTPVPENVLKPTRDEEMKPLSTMPTGRSAEDGST